MKTASAATYRRLNITLPEDAARLIDRVADKGARSRLIAEAIRHYVRNPDRATLRKRLRQGATRRAERDRRLAQDWFFADEEAWWRSGPAEGGLATDSVVLLNEIRSIDTQRIVSRLGKLTSDTMSHVDRALAVSLGLVAL